MKCNYDNQEFDSISEACFYAWLCDACELGIVSHFSQQNTYALTPKVVFTTIKKLKTKDKPVDRTLFQPSQYTSDFEVWWNDFPKDLFLSTERDGDVYRPVTTIDVKGFRTTAGQMAKFSLTQKFMYMIHGIVVNKVVPEVWFAKYGWPIRRLPEECYIKRNPKELIQPWRGYFEKNPIRIGEVCVTTESSQLSSSYCRSVPQ